MKIAEVFEAIRDIQILNEVESARKISQEFLNMKNPPKLKLVRQLNIHLNNIESAVRAGTQND